MYKHKYQKYKAKYLELQGGEHEVPSEARLAAKTVFLVRHGETSWNAEGRGQGQEADISTNEKGKDQAVQTAKYLAKHGPFDCIYASPMKRTKETAKIIKDGIGSDVPIKYDDNLIERRHGKLSGTTKDDPVRIEIEKFKKSFRTGDPIIDALKNENMYIEINKKFGVDLETGKELEKRALKTLDKIMADDCKKILIVGHGGLLLSMIRAIFKIPMVPEGDFSKGDNCWISVLQYTDNDGFRMITPPNTSHL